MGYHTREFEKGEYGEVSKIKEEFEEFLDARKTLRNVLTGHTTLVEGFHRKLGTRFTNRLSSHDTWRSTSQA